DVDQPRHRRVPRRAPDQDDTVLPRRRAEAAGDDDRLQDADLVRQIVDAGVGDLPAAEDALRGEVARHDSHFELAPITAKARRPRPRTRSTASRSGRPARWSAGR